MCFYIVSLFISDHGPNQSLAGVLYGSNHTFSWNRL